MLSPCMQTWVDGLYITELNLPYKTISRSIDRRFGRHESLWRVHPPPVLFVRKSGPCLHFGTCKTENYLGLLGPLQYRESARTEIRQTYFMRLFGGTSVFGLTL